MFGNPRTPSPGFSVEAEPNGTWRPVLKILACRPKDPSSLPPEVAARLTPYGDGCQDANCAKCGTEVVLGPRQALAYDMAPEQFMVCCMICATLLTIMHEEGGSVPFQNLGGGEETV